MQEIKPLWVLSAVLAHGSMNAAAKALAMTPSAVSQHIGRLEQLYGVKLLHRSTRKITPTDAGRALAASCMRLDEALSEARTVLANIKTEAAGPLVMALPSGMAAAPVFQAALKQLVTEHPAIRPRLVFGDDLVDLAASGIDIALRGGAHALDAPDLVARHLADWSWRIYAAPAYLAQVAWPETTSDLLRLQWLNYLPIDMHLSHGADVFHLKVADTLQCNELAAVSMLTLAGLGVSLQLEGEACAHVAAGHLHTLLPQWHLPTVSIYAVTPHRVQSAKVAAALRILQNCFRGGVEQFDG